MENPWNGGGGYAPQQVGDMTMDQIYIRLMELDAFKQKCEMGVGEVADIADEDGKVKVRTEDGEIVYMNIGGKSVVQRIMEGENVGNI